jgi:hypothetical protein
MEGAAVVARVLKALEVTDVVRFCSGLIRTETQT